MDKLEWAELVTDASDKLHEITNRLRKDAADIDRKMWFLRFAYGGKVLKSYAVRLREIADNLDRNSVIELQIAAETRKTEFVLESLSSENKADTSY